MRRAPLRFAITAAAVVATGCGSSSSGAVRAPGAPTVPPAVATTDLPSTTTVPPATTASTTSTTTTTIPPTVPPTTPAPTTTTTVPVVYLRAGDEGPEVSRIQQLLLQTGYLGPGFADGVFDRATNRAVLAFQGEYGLLVDGVVGPETFRSLRAAAASIAE